MSTIETKELALWDLVEIGKDCKEACFERTRRVVEDVGVKVWGFGWKFDEIREERRKEEQQQCEEACFRMKRNCPEAELIREAVEGSSKVRSVGPQGSKIKSEAALQTQADLRQMQPSKDGRFMVDRTHANNLARGLLGDYVKPEGEDSILWPEPAYVNAQDEEGTGAAAARKPSQLAIRRCENEAEQFARTLYSIATKPTKVAFQREDDELKTKNLLPSQNALAANKPPEEHPAVALSKLTPEELGEKFAKRAGRGAMPMVQDFSQGQVQKGSTRKTASGTVIDLDGGGAATGEQRTGAGGDPIAKLEKIKVDQVQQESLKAWSRSAAEGIAFEEKHGISQQGSGGKK